MTTNVKTKGKDIKVKAVLQWPQLKTPNEMSGKYQCDITQLSDKAVAALSDLGLNVRTRDDKPENGNYITAKSSMPIAAHDANGNEIDELIGNGSKAEVILGAYEWDNKYGSGIAPTIRRLTVTNLVPVDRDKNVLDIDGDDDGDEPF